MQTDPRDIRTCVELMLNGELKAEDETVIDFETIWKRADRDSWYYPLDLHEFLGFTLPEYQDWEHKRYTLQDILEARK